MNGVTRQQFQQGDKPRCNILLSVALGVSFFSSVISSRFPRRDVERVRSLGVTSAVLAEQYEYCITNYEEVCEGGFSQRKRMTVTRLHKQQVNNVGDYV